MTWKSRVMLIPLMLAFVAACGDDDPTEPAARIAVNPSTVAFTGTVGGTDPGPETVNIVNSGGGTLSNLTVSTTYGAGQPTGWLETTLAATTAPTTLTLTPDLTDLEEGTYNATVNVASTAAQNSPRPITVTLTVAAAEAVQHTFTYTPPAGAPPVTSVHVPGEHNNWAEDGTPMTLQNGVWQATVPLVPGRHMYKFRINNAWITNMCDNETWGIPTAEFWVDPDASGCLDDGFGGANAYIDIGTD